MPQILARHDIVVVPSIWAEAFGYVVIEAMAVGCAVIASAVGGIPEIITDTEDGLLVPAGECNALGHAIGQLWSDVELRRRLVSNARESSRGVSTWPNAPNNTEICIHVSHHQGWLHEADCASIRPRTRTNLPPMTSAEYSDSAKARAARPIAARLSGLSNRCTSDCTKDSGASASATPTPDYRLIPSHATSVATMHFCMAHASRILAWCHHHRGSGRHRQPRVDQRSYVGKKAVQCYTGDRACSSYYDWRRICSNDVQGGLGPQLQ